MSVLLPFGVLAIVGIYWLMTQILPDRQQHSLLRPGFGHGMLTELNDWRHQRGVPLLEMDEDLMAVAERKAVHQFMTGATDEGWEYPEYFQRMFGRSLLMELVLEGPAASMAEKLSYQQDVFDGEWIGCGVGVAGGASGRVVLVMVLCRDAWEPATEVAEPSNWLARVGLRI